MPLLRLAYSTLYLIALIAVFVAWSQVGGQTHIDLLPWWLKLVLGFAMALAIVRAASAAYSGDRAWNGQTLKWLGLTVALGVVCGMATYYAHMYLEDTGDEGDSQSEPAISSMSRGAGTHARRAGTHAGACALAHAVEPPYEYGRRGHECPRHRPPRLTFPAIPTTSRQVLLPGTRLVSSNFFRCPMRSAFFLLLTFPLSVTPRSFAAQLVAQ
jgi:hypothetical protein